MKLTGMLLLIGAGLSDTAALAQDGLKGEYFSGTNFEQKVLTRVDARVSFDWTGHSPVNGLQKSYYSIRWTGKLLAPVSGIYYFSATVDDGIRLWVGNKKVIDAWALHDNVNFRGSIALEAGNYYDLRVDYFNDLLGGMIDLMWYRPDEADKLVKLVGPAGRPVPAPGSYHTIDGQYLHRTIPTPPNPIVVPPKPVIKPPVVAAVLKPKPVPRPVLASVVLVNPKPAAVATAPPAVSLASPAKKIVPETFGNLEPGKSLVLQSVFFEQSTYVLLPASFPELDKLVRTLQQNPAVRIEIAGHTDTVGDPRLNQSLSEYRARVVTTYLTRHGIADSRVEARGYGGSRPIAGNTTESERARNRRVEFVVK